MKTNNEYGNYLIFHKNGHSRMCEGTGGGIMNISNE